MLMHCDSPYLRRWRVRLLDLAIIGHRCVRVLPCWLGGRRRLRRRRRVDDAQLRAAVLEPLRICGPVCTKPIAVQNRLHQFCRMT